MNYTTGRTGTDKEESELAIQTSDQLILIQANFKIFDG